MLCNVGVLNIYVGLGPCVYRAYPWRNPYNCGSTGHLASNMKEYPEIDPDNFTETLILYDSSLPHFPYVATHMTQISTMHI